jgi:hypothetical protein
MRWSDPHKPHKPTTGRKSGSRRGNRGTIRYGTLPAGRRRHAMPHLRLVIDEPEVDPPAPFLIRDWRPAAEPAEGLDAVAEVEMALGRMQRTLDRLSDEVDGACSFPFPGRHDDDDGPRAA